MVLGTNINVMAHIHASLMNGEVSSEVVDLKIYLRFFVVLLNNVLF